jgi:hypothetical protein
VNAAVMVWSALIVTVHGPVPAQPPPDHPLKAEPEPAEAPRATFVPFG